MIEAYKRFLYQTQQILSLDVSLELIRLVSMKNTINALKKSFI